jgi:DNA-binding response OmpR family regulator
MSQILIIDDDTQVRLLLRKLLDHEGYEVREASNGKAGMKLNRENPADLVITDLIMPEKEGLETIMELRKKFPEVKIIAISGGGRNGPEDYLPMAKELGAQLTFTKPFELKEMLAAVQKLLEQEIEI